MKKSVMFEKNLNAQMNFVLHENVVYLEEDGLLGCDAMWFGDSLTHQLQLQGQETG
jgi:hypothetical protein